MGIEIREARLSDLNNLAILKQQVWISTYATDGLIDVYSKYVLSEYSVENVQRAIEDKSKLTLLAVKNNCILGCVEILLTPQCPITRVDPCIEISTFYILEKFQRIGIGKRLLGECIDKIKRMNHNKVWLTVYYKNQNAIDFYLKQNFKQIGETDFILGKDKHKNYIMIRNIGE
jgi:ribosomal protein S18 acetylase RimI-like enzyme